MKTYEEMTDQEKAEEEVAILEINAFYSTLTECDFADAGQNAWSTPIEGKTFLELYAASCEGIFTEKNNV